MVDRKIDVQVIPSLDTVDKAIEVFHRNSNVRRGIVDAVVSVLSDNYEIFYHPVLLIKHVVREILGSVQEKDREIILSFLAKEIKIQSINIDPKVSVIALRTLREAAIEWKVDRSLDASNLGPLGDDASFTVMSEENLQWALSEFSTLIEGTLDDENAACLVFLNGAQRLSKAIGTQGAIPIHTTSYHHDQRAETVVMGDDVINVANHIMNGGNPIIIEDIIDSGNTIVTFIHDLVENLISLDYLGLDEAQKILDRWANDGRQDLFADQLVSLLAIMKEVTGLKVIALANKKLDFADVQRSNDFLHFAIPKNLKGIWLMGLGLDTTLKFRIGSDVYIFEIGRTLDKLIGLENKIGIVELIGLVARVIRETFGVEPTLISDEEA